MGSEPHRRLGIQQGYFWREMTVSLKVQRNGFRRGQTKIDQPRSRGTFFFLFLLSFLQKKNNSVSFSWQYFKKELSPGTKIVMLTELAAGEG